MRRLKEDRWSPLERENSQALPTFTAAPPEPRGGPAGRVRTELDDFKIVVLTSGRLVPVMYGDTFSRRHYTRERCCHPDNTQATLSVNGGAIL
jgi:hypothetical protein